MANEIHYPDHIEIPKYQLENIQDLLRKVSNHFSSQDKATAFDREVVKCQQYLTHALTNNDANINT